MQILKTMLSVDGEAGSIFKCDTIMHEGEPWLVESWSAVRGGAMQRPVRLIRLGAFAHQVLQENSPFGAFLVNHPIPRAVFHGPTPAEFESDVIEDPTLLVPIANS